MLTFKRYKNNLKIIPRAGHPLVIINGSPKAYLDDSNARLVELCPTSDKELKMLYYACNELGYKHKGYISHTYEEKLNLKKFLLTIS